LTINYIDQQKYEVSINAPSNRETREAASTIDIKNTFVIPTNINSVFIESTEKTLSLFDDYIQTLYRDFMESIVDP